MSKIISQRLEFLQLSDAVQSSPWPGGYSPALPTPPNVTPINTAGVSVTDSYSADTVASAGQTYGQKTIAVNATSTTITLPQYTNFHIYNSGANRLGIVPVGYLTTYPAGPWPVVTVEPGTISSYNQNSNLSAPITQYQIYIINGAFPAAGPIAVSAGNISCQLVFWTNAPASI